MTRIDVVASSRSRKTRATRISTGPSSSLGKLLVVPVAALIAAVLLLPASALAAEPTSGYSQTAPTPKTTPATPTTPTTTTTPKPSTGTSPSKEEKTPSEEKSKEPTKEPTSSTPSSTSVGASKSSTSSTLPFTGLDLRWVVGVGLLLIAAGISITTLQRRHRGERS